jgi:hypothetical protein
MSNELMELCIRLMGVALRDEESRQGIQLRLTECLQNLRVTTQSTAYSNAMTSDSENSPARKAILERWGDKITIKNLIEIAIEISRKVPVNPPAQAEKRRKDLMFNWFHVNWEQIKDCLTDLQTEVESSN